MGSLDEDTSPSPSVTLVNALRNRELYILSDGVPVPLPRANPPILVEEAGERQEYDVMICEEDQKAKARGGSATVEVVGGTSPSLIIGNLPVEPGVWYVVDPITKVQFPHRDDFVVPRAYTMWASEELANELKKKKSKGKGKGKGKSRASKNKKAERKAFAKELERYPHEMRFPLCSVATGPISVAEVSTPVLSDED